jgi:hypothetical protein
MVTVLRLRVYGPTYRPNLVPWDFNLLASWRSTWLESDLQRRRHEGSCHLLARHLMISPTPGYKPWCYGGKKCLNANTDCGRGGSNVHWSATHLPHKHQRQDGVLGIRACLSPQFLKLPCTSIKHKTNVKRTSHLLSSQMYFPTALT